MFYQDSFAALTILWAPPNPGHLYSLFGAASPVLTTNICPPMFLPPCTLNKHEAKLLFSLLKSIPCCLPYPQPAPKGDIDFSLSPGLPPPSKPLSVHPGILSQLLRGSGWSKSLSPFHQLSLIPKVKENTTPSPGHSVTYLWDPSDPATSWALKISDCQHSHLCAEVSFQNWGRQCAHPCRKVEMREHY